MHFCKKITLTIKQLFTSQNKTNASQSSFNINAPVFLGSVIAIVLLISTTLVFGSKMDDFFNSVVIAISNKSGWLFVLSLNVFLGMIIYLGLSKYGRIRLGGPEAKTDFSTSAWVAMLFSAGMGIGLLFYGVAEPISHFAHTPFNHGSTAIEAAQAAMGTTFMHYGFHVWALYGFVSLALAYFYYNRNLPLSIRSLFYPLLGDRINGWFGHTVDSMAVVATLIGLSTSLGVGAQQINAGLTYLFGVEFSAFSQVIIIGSITLLAIASLTLGMEKGVKRLSQGNMYLAFFLLIFVLFVGPTNFIMKSFVQNIGFYLSNFLEMAFYTETMIEAKASGFWQNNWTIFYWAWWVSWTPFVGVFIAKISKGRTIREFCFSMLFIPTLIIFLWHSVFGGSALFQEVMGNHSISEAVGDNIATAIYYMLEQYPLAQFSSGITIVLVVIFFVTSADSGALVVDMLTSKDKRETPRLQKAFWAILQSVIACILLMKGGMDALKAATIASGLPFLIMILVMAFSFFKALKQESFKKVESIPMPHLEPQKESEKKAV